MAGVTVLLVGILLVFIIQDLIQKILRWRKMPPGPWGIPLLGYAPFIDREQPLKTFLELKKKYGNIFTVTIGNVEHVIICEQEIVKDAFSRVEFSYKPDSFVFVSAAEGHNGLLTGHGPTWRDNRRFTLKTLRNFGFGKTTIDGIIQHEALTTCDIFRRHLGKPCDLDYTINVAALNVIWKLTSDQQFSQEDEKAMFFFSLLDKNLKEIKDLGALQFYVWLRHFWPSVKSSFGRIMGRIDIVKETFKSLCKEHKKTFDPNNIRDYIDVYLNEMKEQEEKGEKNPNFNDLQLQINIQDLYFAGSETTGNTVRWAILLLALNPDVQKRAQEEIDSVIGRDRVPSYDDKKRMPYVEGMICEIQRHADVLPFGLPHMTSPDHDVTLAGYTIPKSTTVLAFLYGIHKDKKYWPEPTKFDPTRFLDSNGKLRTKVPGFMPFAHGKRQCLGESLANMELFIFLVTYLQKFTFRLPDGVKTLRTDPWFMEVLSKPHRYNVVVEERL